MSILVIGANGGVGRHLVNQLQEAGQKFTAGVRKEEQVKDLENRGIDTLLIDVANDSIDELSDKLKGFEQVVFSVGSGGSTGADQTIIVDLDGAVKTIDASENAGVNHFVMVSTFDSRREAFDTPDAQKIKPYTIAKHHADEHLKRSSLTYSIVHPGRLTNEPGTKQVELGLYFDKIGDVPREDIASVIYELLDNEDHRGKEVQVISGNEDIKSALKNFKA
ncbi:NAD(P)-binding oxidoreductase [Jeotgalicoccus meleagridis]|uniref:Putative sugar epimerase YhfK n=1 Tax=Jeotgalicoccus meleagridis TaxID=2759181 RepID=A0A6V7R1M8_9STAP|nr:NAD(P)-binding oxidoreductase [Jeotgalicoccus meleagridis]CAD2071239.1 putative sugar epimerase YhfK [Jeotgalicoccus meleagridis]